MSENPPLRDIFDRAVVEDLAGRVAAAYPPFDARRFVEQTAAAIPALGLKDRSLHIAEALRTHLPADYEEALAVLLRSLGPDDGTGGLEGFFGFRFMPYVNFVGRFGLDRPDVSLTALRRLTTYFSAEFDIRHFILRHPDATMERLRAWSRDPDWRVRRLVSEGTRPRLPWAMRLQAFVEDPGPVLALLDRLHDDPHPTVRRSVANNLNDVAKDHPDRAAAAARDWLASGGEGSRWTARHGLRTLVKQGHEGALALLGFVGGDALELVEFAVARSEIRLGEELEFAFALTSREAEAATLSIDYAVHHVKANGRLAPKIFKLAKRRLAPGETLRLSRRHRIAPISTRRYYAGLHRVEILVNGRSLGMRDFSLTL